MVQLGINFVENAEMIYRWDLLQWKGEKKWQLEIYFIAGDLGLLAMYFIENSKIRYGWDFIPENRLK